MSFKSEKFLDERFSSRRRANICISNDDGPAKTQVVLGAVWSPLQALLRAPTFRQPAGVVTVFSDAPANGSDLNTIFLKKTFAFENDSNG